MNTTPEICPKCNGRMLRGYIPDSTYGAMILTSWVQGSARRRWFGGIKAATGAVPIGAFRCEGCGYLEFYARDEFSPE
jgi:hypothetical protein